MHKVNDKKRWMLFVTKCKRRIVRRTNSRPKEEVREARKVAANVLARIQEAAVEAAEGEEVVKADAEVEAGDADQTN